MGCKTGEEKIIIFTETPKTMKEGYICMRTTTWVSSEKLVKGRNGKRDGTQEYLYHEREGKNII